MTAPVAARKRGKETEVGDLRRQFTVSLPEDWKVVPREPQAPAARLESTAPIALPSPEWADTLFLRESLRRKLNRQRIPAEAFSREWFEQVERQRHDRQAPWLPRLLEFAGHEGEALLG